MRRAPIALSFLIATLFCGAIFPACAMYHQSSAQSELAAGKLDAAASDVQSAVASNPDDLQLKQLAAQIFTQRGVKYYQNNEMIAANDDFRRAVDYDRFYGQAWDYLGLIAFQQHRWADAIDSGHKAADSRASPTRATFSRLTRSWSRCSPAASARPITAIRSSPFVGRAITMAVRRTASPAS